MHSAATSRAHIGQRAELTFRHNIHSGRHGWLRLTPAYSVKLVEDLVAASPSTAFIFDPFSGTGTTPLCAACNEREALAADINPFLVWLGNAKLSHYPPQLLLAVESIGRAVATAPTTRWSTCSPPPISNIDRWWGAQDLSELCALKAAILAATQPGSQERDLLFLGFARTMIASSNAAFNHQSMSFKDISGSLHQQKLFDDRTTCFARFARELTTVLRGAADNPAPSARVVLGDSRDLCSLVPRPIDLVVTSPPYPNRMSYIRELRPYMYWLDFLSVARAAGELDWQAIGGTWGLATSRLTSWAKPTGVFIPPLLEDRLAAIRASDGRNAGLLATYVEKYFADIWLHLASLVALMRPGGVVHYVVGNVTFYGTVVPVEQIFAVMMAEAGFSRTAIHLLRKRNSNKHLFEYDVVAVR